MRALSSPGWNARWNERLSGAVLALGLQIGLFALLLQSFPQMRRMPEDSLERILYLPRLVRPPPPTVIDARPQPRAATAPAPGAPAPKIPPALPPYTRAPPGNPSLLRAFGRAVACEPDALGRPSPLVSCRGWRGSRNDLAALAPELPVKREAELAAERARARSNRLPCVSMQTQDLGYGLMEKSVRVDMGCALGELMP